MEYFNFRCTIQLDPLPVHVLPHGGERLLPPLHVAHDHHVHGGHLEEVVVVVVAVGGQLQQVPVQSWARSLIFGRKIFPLLSIVRVI